MPLVMPGRFGVLCSPSPDSEGPFDQGTHCVTVIPKRVTLEEWAELIVACWEEGPFSYGWSPYRSVAVRYFDANDNPIVYREEYYHLAGDEGIYDLIAHRQFLTMTELFRDFTAADLVRVNRDWRNHNGGPLVLDDRLPTLADHEAIQKWVMMQFRWQLYFAFIKYTDWPGWASQELVHFHCSRELELQTQECKRNLQRAKYTIEGYEHFRFSMIFMKQIPKLQSDALACICSFLLGHPIANLHVAGN